MDVTTRTGSFLESVKDSLSKLGVDPVKLTRITSQVSDASWAQSFSTHCVIQDSLCENINNKIDQ